MIQNKLLSLVVPVYFEEECIDQFILETTAVLDSHKINYEILFIDDGSKDKTVDKITQHIETNKKIKLIVFSYNHGKQAAVTAGIKNAKGDYLLYMDPDLQDPPVEIPRFLEEIEKGYDLVFGVREQKRDSFINRIYSKLFWWTLDKFTGLKIPKGLAVMRIFNRNFANRFIKYGEQNRFIEGIFMHIGMRQHQITISQRERFAGQSKFNFKRKMKLALDAIFDFSELPLKLTIRLGIALTIVGLFALVGIVIARLFVIEFQIGWPSLMSAIIMGFGVQLLFMGIMARYIGNIYKEVKQRPLYSVREYINIEE